MGHAEYFEKLCEEMRGEGIERTEKQSRLLLMEIGTYLNMVISDKCPDRMKISRLEAIRDEKLFNETLDKIEELSKLIWWKLDHLDRDPSGSSNYIISHEDRECLLGASAYINNLVRKVETVGECTGTMIRGPKI